MIFSVFSNKGVHLTLFYSCLRSFSVTKPDFICSDGGDIGISARIVFDSDESLGSIVVDFSMGSRTSGTLGVLPVAFFAGSGGDLWTD